MSDSNSVVVYSSAFCPFCHQALRLLASKGVEPEIRSVDGDPTTHQEMMGRSGRHTVPQIFVGDHHVGGCDDLYDLERSQQLDPLLTAA
ncbi:MAG: glutaredoxin 3 [Chromatiales bacterium]|jgi:glutaredoxin 3|nr:glutaredoxin 3 [Chromatiales bacterium]